MGSVDRLLPMFVCLFPILDNTFIEIYVVFLDLLAGWLFFDVIVDLCCLI